MMTPKRPEVDYKTCMACGICVQACPFSCLSLARFDIDALKKAYPVLISPETCTGCGICRTACPVDSIQMLEQTLIAVN
jgi:ferredoxin